MHQRVIEIENAFSLQRKSDFLANFTANRVDFFQRMYADAASRFACMLNATQNRTTELLVSSYGQAKESAISKKCPTTCMRHSTTSILHRMKYDLSNDTFTLCALLQIKALNITPLWDMDTSIFFAVTVVTTIGYG